MVRFGKLSNHENVFTIPPIEISSEDVLDLAKPEEKMVKQ